VVRVNLSECNKSLIMTKKSKQDPQHEPAGRIAFDDRGNAVWEWRTDTGTFSCDVDTLRVRALQEASGVQLGDVPVPPGVDPYSTADTAQTTESKAPRRTLNDMRRLSEEIKSARKKSSE
jgi:hypothetical protein